jgi:hypothetical protein
VLRVFHHFPWNDGTLHPLHGSTRAASAELFERYARSDAAQWIPAALSEMGRALNDHDRCSSCHPT